MIEIFSTSPIRKDQKKLLENITNAFLDNNIIMERAIISGKKISIICENKNAIKILKKMYGIERIKHNDKEYKGGGGLPSGSRGRAFVEKKKYIKLAKKAGFEIVENEFDVVISKNLKKWKEKGVLALDFSYYTL